MVGSSGESIAMGLVCGCPHRDEFTVHASGSDLVGSGAIQWAFFLPDFREARLLNFPGCLIMAELQRSILGRSQGLCGKTPTEAENRPVNGNSAH